MLVKMELLILLVLLLPGSAVVAVIISSALAFPFHKDMKIDDISSYSCASCMPRTFLSPITLCTEFCSFLCGLSSHD